MGVHTVAVGGNKILVAWRSQYAEVFALDGGPALRRIEFTSRSLITAAIDSRGERVLILSDDGETVELGVWSTTGEEPPMVLHSGEPVVNDAAFDSAGLRVAGAVSDNRVCLWDLEQEGPARAMEPRLPNVEPLDMYGDPGREWDDMRRRAFGMVSVAFVPGGPWLAGVSEKGGISVWDIQTGDQVLYFPVPRSSHYSDLQASPDGRWLIVLARDNGVPRLFELWPEVPDPAEIEAWLAQIAIHDQSMPSPEGAAPVDPTVERDRD